MVAIAAPQAEARVATVPAAPPSPVTVTMKQKVAAVATPVTTLSPKAPENARDSVKERILSLAVEKTGYPQDMLDLDLDLEADLGVDTVKQAEIFAAIREIYNIPRDENRKLRDYPTLAHVIRFVFEKRPDLVIAGPAEAAPTTSTPKVTPTALAPAATAPKEGATGSVKERILALAVEKTGYPQDMLDLGPRS